MTYSNSDSSTVRPPTSALLARIASRIFCMVMPRSRIRCGSRIDVVLLDEAADARDLGDAFGLGEREFQIPVLDRARVREVQLLRHHRILVDPADAGRVGADRRRHAGRQPRRRAVEEFEHARARPVDVGAVFEDDVDKRDAEEREAAHDFRLRHGQHRGRQRIGDLVLDHLRRLARDTPCRR